jgi:ER membrane protein complex subunit 7
MRAEFEERQKNNPMNSILGGGAQSGQGPIGNFDMAAFLAGSSKKEEASKNGKGGKR